MRQITLRIVAITCLATVFIIPGYSQTTAPTGAASGVLNVQGAISSSTSSGPGGMTSMRSDGQGQTFTYNFPKGANIFAVTGAPYAGRMSSQTVRTLANGTHLTQQAFDQPMTYRDSMGRTRTDEEKSRIPDIPGAAAAAAKMQPQIMRLAEIVDPVAGYRIILDPSHQIAHRIAIQARQNQAQLARPANARVAAAVQTQMPPRTLDNGATVTNENLGTETIFGITATGRRNTTTYPVGAYQGNDQPVVMVNETWQSAQYGIVLRSSNTGPNGDSTTTMKDFTLGEPDPSLFQIPAGYQVVDETGEFTITIQRNAQ